MTDQPIEVAPGDIVYVRSDEHGEQGMRGRVMETAIGGKGQRVRVDTRRSFVTGRYNWYDLSDLSVEIEI